MPWYWDELLLHSHSYWPSSSPYARWPEEATILGCKGGTNTATITIGPGLQANGMKSYYFPYRFLRASILRYVLRIAIIGISYPLAYDDNLWVVSLRGDIIII